MGNRGRERRGQKLTFFSGKEAIYGTLTCHCRIGGGRWPPSLAESRKQFFEGGGGHTMTQEEETRRRVIKYSFFPLPLSFLSCALLSRQARKSFLPPLASYLLCEEGQNALLAKSGRKRGALPPTGRWFPRLSWHHSVPCFGIKARPRKKAAREWRKPRSPASSSSSFPTHKKAKRTAAVIPQRHEPESAPPSLHFFPFPPSQRFPMGRGREREGGKGESNNLANTRRVRRHG